MYMNKSNYNQVMYTIHYTTNLHNNTYDLHITSI